MSNEEIKKKNAVVLIAESESEIVGYAFLRIEEESFIELLKTSVWLHDIYLAETARGAGIGKTFFEAIKKAARDLGSDSLMLSVSPHNPTARKFFEQQGFRSTLIEMRLDFVSN